jgi:hypothetical protein
VDLQAMWIPSFEISYLKALHLSDKASLYVKLETSLGECKTATADKTDTPEWNEVR